MLQRRQEANCGYHLETMSMFRWPDDLMYVLRISPESDTGKCVSWDRTKILLDLTMYSEQTRPFKPLSLIVPLPLSIRLCSNPSQKVLERVRDLDRQWSSLDAVLMEDGTLSHWKYSPKSLK